MIRVTAFFHNQCLIRKPENTFRLQVQQFKCELFGETNEQFDKRHLLLARLSTFALKSKVLVVEMKYGMWRFTMVNDYAFNAFNAKRYWTAVKAATQQPRRRSQKGSPKIKRVKVQSLNHKVEYFEGRKQLCDL